MKLGIMQREHTDHPLTQVMDVPSREVDVMSHAAQSGVNHRRRLSVKMIYYDDAVIEGVVYVLAHSDVDPKSSRDCDTFIAQLLEATVGYTTRCVRGPTQMESHFAAPLFVLHLRDFPNGTYTDELKPHRAVPQRVRHNRFPVGRREAIDRILAPTFRRQIIMSAEVVRVDRRHLDTIIELDLHAGDPFGMSECAALRGDPDVGRVVWNPSGITSTLRLPVLPDNVDVVGGDQYVLTVGKRLVRKLSGFTTITQELMEFHDPDPKARLHCLYDRRGTDHG